ncbi:YbbR-like domain-containing protein [Enterococcus thailandicus]|uniref:CdaR family protein n=1 Tax=Enterococcus thailandicus TaxID=417368 RepID=UPI0035D89746
MISKEKRTSIFYGFIALMFSIVLYFNANNQSTQSVLSGSESYTQTVSDVPIQLSYDSEKYYIHGFVSTAKVKLTSANRVQLNAESNVDTRTFRLSADLTKLSEGTHEVSLRVRNLSSAVNAKVEPSTITVTIEKRVEKDFEVTTILPSETTPSGYQLDTVSETPKKVSITTGDKTLAEINQVVAEVNASDVTDDGINSNVAVQALNSAGEALSIIADPVHVRVQADAIKPTKTVRLYGTQQGVRADGVKSYDFNFSKLEAEVTGTSELLEQLGDSIIVPIDVSGITHRLTREYEIPVSDGLSVSPKKVSVEITPVLEETTNRSSSSRSESSADRTSTTQSGTDTTRTTTPSTSNSSSSSDTQATSTEESINETVDSTQN